MNENIYFSLACLLGAVYAYYHRVKKYNKATERAKFPTVKGTITQSSVKTVENTTRNDDGSTDTSISYVPQVSYRYEVNGTTFENNRIAVLDQQDFGRKESADQYISPYGEGKEIPVYFDPSNPKESFLDNSISNKKIDGGTWILILALLAGAVYLLFNQN